MREVVEVALSKGFVMMEVSCFDKLRCKGILELPNMHDSESDDEWFCNSIKRYNELIMFDTGDPVSQIALCDKNTICALSERNPYKQMISVLSLPSIMAKTSLDQMVKRTTDLKIKSGVFTTNAITQILAVYDNNRLLTSQKEVDGIELFSLNYSESDQLVHEKTIHFPRKNPKMALLQKDRIVLAGASDKEPCIGDLNRESVLCDINLGASPPDNFIPSCVDQNVVAFTSKRFMTTVFFDVRQLFAMEVGSIKGEYGFSWTSSTDYLYYQSNGRSESICFLSNGGHFICYDRRDLSQPVTKLQLPYSTAEDNLKIGFNPSNRNMISVSGFDDCVYLFNRNENKMSEIFKHDGHSRTENCTENPYVTDHVWYSDEYVISAALNNSINCWVPNIPVGS